jgi:hypothetical protein
LCGAAALFSAGIVGVAVALASIPFLLAGHRLADRSGAVLAEQSSLLGPGRALRYFGHALAEFAGGGPGPILAITLVLALLGFTAAVRVQAAFAAFAALALVAPVVLLAVTNTSRRTGDSLSTRHLIYGLPVWAALIGAGTALLIRRLPAFAQIGCVVGLVVALALAPASGIRDPRTRIPFDREVAARTALAEPASWIESRVQAQDLLYYPSPVFLQALPGARRALMVDPALLGRSLARASYPVAAVFVAVPVGNASLDRAALVSGLPSRTELDVSRPWLVLRLHGPFSGERGVLRSLVGAFGVVTASTPHPSVELQSFLRRNLRTVSAGLRRIHA